jgi:hypothetical protein
MPNFHYFHPFSPKINNCLYTAKRNKTSKINCHRKANPQIVTYYLNRKSVTQKKHQSKSTINTTMANYESRTI